MLRSLRTAEQAMKIHQVRIDVLANNMANANTTGFRQVLTQVMEKDPEQGITVDRWDDAGRGDALARGDVPGRDSRRTGPGSLELRVATDVRSGPLRPTGNDTDLAIAGEGFFVLEGETGEYYSRSGAFMIDAEKRLTAQDGAPVQGTGGPITIDGSSFSIGSDGTVTVDGSEAGRIKIVTFENHSAMKLVGDNKLSVAATAEAREVPREEVQLEQGMLEDSNVNAIDTMVDMIAAQRAFEVHSKIVQTTDDTLNKSVNELGRVNR